MPAKAYLYGLPIEYYKNYKVRRYGFHGTSHSFVSKRAVEFLGLDKDNSKAVSYTHLDVYKRQAGGSELYWWIYSSCK